MGNRLVIRCVTLQGLESYQIVYGRSVVAVYLSLQGAEQYMRRVRATLAAAVATARGVIS